MATISDIENEIGPLRWGRPIRSRFNGRTIVRQEAPATDRFWQAWHRCKACVIDAGFRVAKSSAGWIVSRNIVADAEKAQTESVPAVELARVDRVPVPAGLSLLPYQLDDVRALSEMPAALLAHEQGLGKTVILAALCNAVSARRILIIAPARLLHNWRDELAKWLIDPAPALVVSTASASAISTAAGPVVVSYETAVRPDVLAKIKSISWDVFVADEAHALNNADAQRTIALIGPGGIRATRRILATGTPFKNRPIELWPLLRYLDPERWASRHQYGLRYCAAFHDGMGWDYSGSSNLDELNGILRETVMIRRTKAEAIKLPPKTQRLVVIPPDATARALIEREAELRKLEAADPDDIAAMLGRADLDDGENLSILRRELAMRKLPAIAQHVEELARAGEKVVVFVHHRELGDALAQRWGAAAVRVVGGQTPKQTSEAVRRFQTDPSVSVVIASIRAAGAGLPLTAACRVVFAECDWSPGVMSQAEDRCHRIGQRRPVIVEHLVFDGSLDCVLYGVNAGQRRAARQAFA